MGISTFFRQKPIGHPEPLALALVLAGPQGRGPGNWARPLHSLLHTNTYHVADLRGSPAAPLKTGCPP